ncbi:conserved hypothetical protein [Ixodes scapularis]|uniref:Protein kinase domain-containing protein n=1 Tax=Ixodes scapularis TaxID=6945 RepID=B7PZ64_IXOSC|nr:conserved hypothetical protein [Ixodes scapularis]|eukprot:XP_002404827.1 conserved hypothetical protein [Ixodes scapularis]
MRRRCRAAVFLGFPVHSWLPLSRPASCDRIPPRLHHTSLPCTVAGAAPSVAWKGCGRRPWKWMQTVGDGHSLNSARLRPHASLSPALSPQGKDGAKVTTVLATPGQGPDRPQEVSYSDTKVIGNGSFGVVYQARLLDTAELVAIKKVLQDKRFKASPPVSRFTYDGWRPLVPMSWAVFATLGRRRPRCHPRTLSLETPENRELQIMRRLDHCNIVKLKYFFYSSGDEASCTSSRVLGSISADTRLAARRKRFSRKQPFAAVLRRAGPHPSSLSLSPQKDEVYLNLVLEYIPETVYRVARHYSKSKQTIPISFIKLYMYQLFRSLAYIHSLGICHRDIKPQNLLLDPETGVLKLCDFGSMLTLDVCVGKLHVAEAGLSGIFGATVASTCLQNANLPLKSESPTSKRGDRLADVWSAGCVLAELLLGQPIFPGDSGVDQLVEIIKVLGTPTKEQIREMNRNYTEFKFPQIKAHPWQKVFRARTPPEAIELVARLLEYTPSARVGPLQACAHAFFDELREPGTRLPNGRDLPPLFDFTDHELSLQPHLNATLIPAHARASGPDQAAAASSSQPAKPAQESATPEASTSSTA